MKMTRRRLAGLMATTALFTGRAPAQAPSSPKSPGAEPTPKSPPAEPGAARDDFQSAARQLDRVKLARSVEPATRFEA
jgi:hypothetical protein